MSTSPSTLDEAFAVICEELQELFIKKHKDYGKENILEIQELGMAFRMQEKISRLKNLLQTQQAPANESIEDTIKDIATYAIIFELYRRKWFQDLEVKS